MTYVLNSERSFKDDAIDGLAAAYARCLRRVPGTAALASVAAPEPGRVATIIGGGSGHYPAFAGLVGPGLADAAVCGDVFASPSAQQVHRTIRAVDGGAGVLMLFGNYAGDVMHFGLAADQAAAQDGIDARIVLVTDDIASAPPERAGDRRGIAGGFFVFRAAAAAAHRGDSLDDVERAAAAANAATRTIGVGFDGCTLPGRGERLFTVPEGSMELGLGIHGESGIQTVPRVGARELGADLVARLLAERPDGAERARVLVNGLGRVKYEELFALYLAVSEELAEAGVQPVEPEVGEFVTSLDMAGCSVTLVWTDDELDALLATPAHAPGYTRAARVESWDGDVRPLPRFDEHEAATAMPADALDDGGWLARRALAAIAARLHELESRLGELDAAAGDGDHGTTMTRGIDAAVEAAEGAGPDAPTVLTAAGMAFADAAGGAAGALWGSGLTTIGATLAGDGGNDGDAADGSAARVARALRAAQDAVMRLGGCAVGDKTLVDALDPFVTTFAAAADGGARVADAWRRAARAADEAAHATTGLAARRGRAARQAERSTGVQDPGATSLAAALDAVGTVLEEWRASATTTKEGRP